MKSRNQNKKLPQRQKIIVLIVTILIGLSFCNYTIAQNNSYSKIFQDVGTELWHMDYPHIDTINQNSYLISGSLYKLNFLPTDSFQSSKSLISKNDINGNTIWSKTYSSNGFYTYLKSFCVLDNKEIVACGSLMTYNSVFHGFLLKLDSVGQIIWSKQIPNMQFNYVTSLKNNRFAFVAIDSIYPYWTTIVGVVNSSGDILWSKKIHDNYQYAIYGVKIIENINNDLLVVGIGENINGTEGIAILLDSLGNKKNEIISASTSNIWTCFSSVCQDSSGFMIAGAGPTTISNQFGPLIIRTDVDLNIKWQKNFYTDNNVSEFIDISSINKNNYIILTEPEGHGNNPPGNLRRMGIALIDSNCVFGKDILITNDSIDNMPIKFKLLKDKKILFTGFSYHKIFFGLTDTMSTGFCGFKNIIFTNCFPSTILKSGMLVVPVNLSFTPITFNVELLEDVIQIDQCELESKLTMDIEESEFEVYPIPAHNSIFIKSSEIGQLITNIELYNNNGEIVKTNTVRQGIDLFNINISVEPGIYYLKMYSKKGISKTHKILIY